MPDVMAAALTAADAAVSDKVMPDILRLEGLSKSYQGQHVLHAIDLAMRQREFLTLLGPSGCGKTTTLNLVAGLLAADGGRIWLRGQDATRTPPRRRNLGLVFQSWALFPHMTVFENVAYGLRVRGMPRPEIGPRVREMLDIVRLSAAAGKFPSQLSGGMQQRVALARALAPRPDLLLLDEPLSNLDAALRKEMQGELRRIHEALGVSTLLVTHSQEEALVMSDRIAVMRGGHIACLDTPARIYEQPPSAFVCTFMGDANILDAVVERVEGAHARLRCGALALDCDAPGVVVPGAAVQVALRPESIGLQGTEGTGPEAVVLGTVFRGAAVAYRLEAGGQVLDALTLPGAAVFAPGSRVRLDIPAGRVIVLERE